MWQACKSWSDAFKKIPHDHTILTFSPKTILPEIEKKCEGALLRIHQSYLVNPEHVSRIWRFEVELDNGMTLPVPEKKYTEIKGKLGTV